MLTREQVYCLMMLRTRGDNLFAPVPKDIIRYLSDFGQDPHNDIHVALRLGPVLGNVRPGATSLTLGLKLGCIRYQ